jgi:hypothetical protein
MELVDQIPQLPEIDLDALENWIDSESHDKGFAVYADQIIVDAVRLGKDPLDLLEDQHDESFDETLGAVETETVNESFDKESALTALKACIKWADPLRNESLKNHLHAAIEEIKKM